VVLATLVLSAPGELDVKQFQHAKLEPRLYFPARKSPWLSY
jgi:hypothetical protein